LALPHNGMGNVLFEKRDYDAAIVEYKKAIHLEAHDPLPHNGLGNALAGKREYDAAMVEFKEAIRLDPSLALPHSGMGNVLRLKKQYDAAMVEFKEAIRLDRNFAFAYANLGLTYRQLGKFDASIDSFRKAAKMMPNHPGFQKELRVSQDCQVRNKKLQAIHDGTWKPTSPAETIGYADFAAQDFKKEYALAYRLYTDAFGADPKLAPAHGYNAARAAVLLAAGKDVRVRPEIEESCHLRELARRWLADHLDVVQKLAASGKTADRERVRAGLVRWLEDPDLAGVRDKSVLEKLPDAERAEWEKLWADVAE
jgi:tetratricopeptide (TPR) repeat protein